MNLLLIPGVLLVGVVAALSTFPWRTRRLGDGWPWIALTPIPPIVSHIWGIAFAVEPGGMPPPPHWHEDVLLWLLALSVVLVVVVPWRMKQARPFAMSIGLLMLGATLVAGLLASMRVSGAWI